MMSDKQGSSIGYVVSLCGVMSGLALALMFILGMVPSFEQTSPELRLSYFNGPQSWQFLPFHPLEHILCLFICSGWSIFWRRQTTSVSTARWYYWGLAHWHLFYTIFSLGFLIRFMTR